MSDNMFIYERPETRSLEAMNTHLRAARRMLGLVRRRTVDAARIRVLEARVRSRRDELKNLLPQLPQVRCVPSGTFHVTMLCGHTHVDMGILASWSLLRFLPPSSLCIVSDGSLTDRDKRIWERVIDSVRFIDVEEGNALAASRVKARYPNLWHLRNTHVVGRKLIDVHCSGEASVRVLMDSDVLCFQPPEEILSLAENSDRPFAWNRDFTYAYPASYEVLNDIFRLEFPIHVNSGFLVLHQFSDEQFGLMEDVIGRIIDDGRIAIDEFLLEQTLYAVCSTLNPNAGPLPEDYAVHAGRTRAKDVVRHYVGEGLIRPRFFLEGVPRIVRQLRLEGPLSSQS